MDSALKPTLDSFPKRPQAARSKSTFAPHLIAANSKAKQDVSDLQGAYCSPSTPKLARPHPERSATTPGTSFTSPAALRPIATNSRVRQDEKYRKDMYLSYVKNALQQKLAGNSEAFDDLVRQFRPKQSLEEGGNIAQVRLWISALSHVVSRLERAHSALVEAVVNMPWTSMDNATVKSYTIFIGMLLSARPEYLSLILGKIAQGFTHQSGIQTLDSGLPESSSSPLTRRVIYDRLHNLLRHILSLIPTLPLTLYPLLVRHFPHKRQSQVAQSTYIRNLLRVSMYCDELADKILATIVQRAIQIDVEIQVELEEIEERESALDLNEIDPFDTVVGQEGDEPDSDEDDNDDGDNFSDLSTDGENDDEEEGQDNATDIQHIHDMVQKLDIILSLLFGHFTRTQTHGLPPLPPLPVYLESPPFPSSPATPSSPAPPSSPTSTDLALSSSIEQIGSLRRTQFYTLLMIFHRTVIRTFKSRYTQFLLFWFSSLDPEFSDLFQGMLISTALLDPEQPAVTRAAAASYIASFVSRALFVDREGTRKVVGVLCAFLQNHLDTFDMQLQSGAVLPDISRHSVFYAVSQAVFLIFCFRWRDLLEEHVDDGNELLGGMVAGKKWMPELDVVQRVVTSVLNPLKICSSNVVMQFARVAHATDFIYCYSIMESNKRSEYSSSTNSDSRNSRPTVIHPALLGKSINAELNTFFPFDPYKLPRSSSYIQPLYREWTSVAIDDDDEDEDEDEVDEGEDNDDDDAGSIVDGLRSRTASETEDITMA